MKKKRNNKMKMKMKKRGTAPEVTGLIWWIVAIVFLIVMVIVYIYLRRTNLSLIELFKNLFRFR